MSHPRSRLRAAVLAAAVGLVAVLAVALPEAAAQDASPPGLGPRGELVRLQFEQADKPMLRGRDARRQFVVSGVYSSGQLHDLTRLVEYRVEPAGIVEVDPHGFVTPLVDGQATLTAQTPEGMTASLEVTVDRFHSPIPVNFRNQVVPIFTKFGCNSGGCHGKSGGQNGFKLSLLGFEPDEDYEFLVKEARGRRLFPSAPEYSLILLKPTNAIAHGGGRRMEEDSYEWQVLKRWVEQGAPYGSGEEAVVERIEVVPATRSMNRGSEQQVSVIAHYSDGTTEDVTRMATIESNDPEMAEATPTGVVRTFDIPGEVAVMARFQEHVAVFRASIPLGYEVKPPAERNFIDRHVFAKLTTLGIPPSEPCDDSTFIRRVHLDLTGQLPTAEAVQEFLASQDSAKRDKLIDVLLERPQYVDYFANKWNLVLRNTRNNNNGIPVTFAFHDWLRRAIQSNMPYDEFVRNILAASGDPQDHPPAAWYRQLTTTLDQVEDGAQLFLGLRIQCARCHHHPFEQWSQDDYYGFAAFFSRVGTKPGRRTDVNQQVFHQVGAATATNPRTGAALPPTGLGAEPLDIPPYEDPRHALVDWMAAPDNPFFARALVNRYWKHFFSRGLVEPEDDMRVTNPASNPALLDALAESFVASGFDLKQLIRTICRSQAYQLSSEPNAYNRSDRQNFSSYYPKRMNAEVLYDALNQVTGTGSEFQGLPAGTRAVQLPDNGFDNYFLRVFGKPEAQSACECERSGDANLAQALHLLNSAEVQGKLTAEAGRAALLAADEERTDAERIENLYLWAFARPPRQSELDLILPHLAVSEDKRQAYGDVLWALLNTKEFLFNH